MSCDNPVSAYARMTMSYPSLVPRRSTHRGEERLVTLLDFLGPNTFPSLEFELANQIVALSIKLCVLPC